MSGVQTGTVTSADGTVIAGAGGSAVAFGGSSGAGLALRAAVQNPAITRLALWEPPCHVDDSAPPLPDDFADQLDRLVEAGRRSDAVELFLVRAVQARPRDVAGMRGQASWPAMEAAAQSLAYEARVMARATRCPRNCSPPSPSPPSCSTAAPARSG